MSSPPTKVNKTRAKPAKHKNTYLFPSYPVPSRWGEGGPKFRAISYTHNPYALCEATAQAPILPSVQHYSPTYMSENCSTRYPFVGPFTLRCCVSHIYFKVWKGGQGSIPSQYLRAEPALASRLPFGCALLNSPSTTCTLGLPFSTCRDGYSALPFMRERGPAVLAACLISASEG